ncbi:GPR1/FUN34/YaaH family transporter [Streptomyces lichenis]|uniref:GPR1/FUN34/YaaH family transporter n=1 Tax=Streptomyces lichenis TaxID=2306967 RepID=A0ABT0IC55_9ACTN|nr:GPR1/FUN34/YaaH family transporter [Streptomyces lichenis]MCK8678872.1 GPR1/FUN34/YaaH family transporter [Streptomyces lichenis]
MSDDPATAPGHPGDSGHLEQSRSSGRHFEPDLRRMTRITLRPIASPMPVGFFAVAIASVLVGSMQLGLFGEGAHRAVALAILPAFVLQLVVAVLAFGARDVLAASLMSCFSGTWLASALVLAVDPPQGTRVLGALNLVFALFALLMATVAHRKRVMWFVLCAAVPRFTAAALANLTGAHWAGLVSGALGLLLAAVAMFAAFALMLEDMAGEEVLFVGRKGPAGEAVDGDLSVQLRNLERQAGVRRTL